jgi:Tol biopolymer transport system component
MALTPGSRFGPYEIVSPLGAGGMGEVYRAHDARLGRDVAVKVLPAEISADPSRRQRFQVEARAIAALSHPNICAIHDVGSDEGFDYLVLELVEGETLAARLVRGPLPIAEALARAREIAAGVDAAHRMGVIHRDLKPGNIMLARAGVKILDFGLAKVLREEATAASAMTAAATGPLTGTATVLGTLQYMAPEQIEGRPADTRTDVFAFGAVLYEMVTGRKAFDASSTPGLIGAILRDAVPSVTARQPGLPDSLDRVIRTCLAKNPDARFASMHDVGIALDWVARDLESPQAIRASVGARAPSKWLWAAVAALTLVGTLAGYWYGRGGGRSIEQSSTYMFDIALPEGTTHAAGIALSPDGRRVALVTRPTQAGLLDLRLWIRDLAASEWQLVSGAGEEIPTYPFWSPDSRSLAFFVGKKLVRADLPNTAPIPICDAPDARGGAWLTDGTIVFAPTTQSGLMRVSASGGTPEILLDRREGEAGLKYPAVAGDGRLLYWAQTNDPARTEIRVMRIADPLHSTPVARSERTGAYDGATLFYSRNGVFIGQPFDARTGRLAGQVVRVAMDQFGVGNIGAVPISAARGLVAVANVRLRQTQLRWVDRAGKPLAELGASSTNANVDISPNGRRVAVERTVAGESQSSVWLVDAETGTAQRAAEGDGADPLWAPDNRHLAFGALRGMGGNYNLYQVDVDGPQTVTPILEMAGALDSAGWIPDGGFLLYSRQPVGSLPPGIVIRPPSGTLSTFRVSKANEFVNVRLSPDGQRIAYVSRETGQQEVFVDAFPSPDAHPLQVTHGGGSYPRWRADGRELFFIASDRLMAAPVPGGSAVSVGAASPLFTLPSNSYAVHPDGQRFLVLVPTTPASSTVRITLNLQSR